MKIACYEVLLDGLTFVGKVWAAGEVVMAKDVPAQIRRIWDNPTEQENYYGKFIVRPRPHGFIGEVAANQEAVLGITESVGTITDEKAATVGPRPPSLGLAEVGITGNES